MMKKYIVIRLFFLASSVAIAQVMLPAFQRDSQTTNLKSAAGFAAGFGK